MKKLLLLIIVAFASCSKNQDFSKIKKGMPLKQVVELVGEPIEKQEIPFFSISAKFYKYDKHVIIFANDTVTRVGTKEEIAKSMEAGLGNLSEDIDKIDSAIQEYKDMKPAN